MTSAIPSAKGAWCDLGALEGIPPGQGRCFQAGDRTIAVFRLRNGALYALDALCPHRGGRLAEGLLDQEKVLCPLHGFAFSLHTGAGLGHPLSVCAYAIEAREGRMFLKNPEA